jgi:beta-glucosidase
MNRRTLVKLASWAGLGMIVRPAVSYGPFYTEDMTSTLFGDQFSWGAASSAYQIEGAWNTDGKGESIWDRFAHEEGNITNNDTGDMACDYYHRYREDIGLLKKMNFRNFRFSLAWTRILPDGHGRINQKGLDFYRRVIETCLEFGIEPWVTLYHWDLPQALEMKGGWTNRDIIGWFSEYADVASRAFGDTVDRWMVLNEPLAFTGLGYMIGEHAPGKKGYRNFFRAAHHAALCQAQGGRVVRNNVPSGKIGSTFSAAHISPADDRAKTLRAVDRLDALMNRFFIEPAMGLGYPDEFSGKMEPYMIQGDDVTMSFDFDFVGLQNYTRHIGRKSWFPPVLWANEVDPEKLGLELTSMGWEVYPEGIYLLLKKFANYPVKEIVVTENGASFKDAIEKDKVHDPRREDFLKRYLAQVLRAKNEGVPVTGYFVWALTDNFEWSHGYEPRFGLVYIDYTTQDRIIKDSGYWFSEFLSNHAQG